MTFAEQQPEINTELAYERVIKSGLVMPTQFISDPFLSEQYDSEIILVSELGQETGAYKERGVSNWFAEHSNDESFKEVVTVSAGNHAAAVAKAAKNFSKRAVIFMPSCTPSQKIENVNRLGDDNLKVFLSGNTVDEAANAATDYLNQQDARTAKYIHPYDDPAVVSGQGTIGHELLEKQPDVDVAVVPVGGGGLLSGIVHATKERSQKDLHYIAVEPAGAASLTHNLMFPNSALPRIDTYVDGAAVKRVGQTLLNTLHVLGEENFTVVRPTKNDSRRAVTYFWEDKYTKLQPEIAGALAVASLRYISKFIQNKKVAVFLTGGNLGQDRYEKEVKLAGTPTAFTH